MNQNQAVRSTTPEFSPEEMETMKKIINFAKSIIESLNTGAIANLAQTMATMGVMLDDINTPEMREMLTKASKNSNELATLLDRVTTLQKDGTIDSLLEMATFIVAVKRAMSTDIIAKIGNVLPDPKMINKLEKIIDASNQTKVEMEKNPPQVGLFSLLKLLKDPGVQYLLGYVVLFSNKATNILKEE